MERAIVERSEGDGISLTKAATQLIEQELHLPVRNSDFDEFAGIWTAEAADEFDLALAAMRQVDPEDWKR